VKRGNTMKKIYQLVCFVNAWNKRTKQWENLRSVTKVYVGKEGLKTAYIHFDNEKREYQFIIGQNLSKYGAKVGKVEIQEPFIHPDGSLAYWGDKVLQSYDLTKI
jgi:hypothetical protein